VYPKNVRYIFFDNLKELETIIVWSSLSFYSHIMVKAIKATYCTCDFWHTPSQLLKHR